MSGSADRPDPEEGADLASPHRSDIEAAADLASPHRPDREIARFADAEQLAAAAAAALVTELAAAQAERGEASLVLTGGGTGTAVLSVLPDAPGQESVAWDKVEIWWGDERFVDPDDPDRNELGARTGLLDRLPFTPERVHPMPADAAPYAGSPELAAAAYAMELAAFRRARPDVAPFDICLLGVGQDAHVASLFPGAPTADPELAVAAVHDSPKPPPTRLTLSFDTICSARQVWLLAAGAGKAAAVGLAVGDPDRRRAPASAVRGRERTVLWLDEAAGAELPAGQLPG